MERFALEGAQIEPSPPRHPSPLVAHVYIHLYHLYVCETTEMFLKLQLQK